MSISLIQQQNVSLPTLTFDLLLQVEVVNFQGRKVIFSSSLEKSIFHRLLLSVEQPMESSRGEQVEVT